MSRSPRPRRFFLSRPGILIAALIGSLAAIGLTVAASKAEEHDGFCAACHTLPEETYYDRAQAVRALQAGAPVDLAAAHVGERGSFGCIECHRGDQSLNDRGRTLMLGARDALVFVSGQADERIEKGATSTPDLLNRACFQCHTKTLVGGGFNNHFHSDMAVALPLQSASFEKPLKGSSLTCTDCHRAHVITLAGQDQEYLDMTAIVFPACVKCHREVGRGPLKLGG